MLTFILQENVLSNNMLLLPENGKIFKGGYVGIVKEYQFANAWNDKEIIKRFRKSERLLSYIKTAYPDADLDFSETSIYTK